jgi:hypothetical protein
VKWPLRAGFCGLNIVISFSSPTCSVRIIWLIYSILWIIQIMKLIILFLNPRFTTSLLKKVKLSL